MTTEQDLDEALDESAVNEMEALIAHIKDGMAHVIGVSEGKCYDADANGGYRPTGEYSLTVRTRLKEMPMIDDPKTIEETIQSVPKRLDHIEGEPVERRDGTESLEATMKSFLPLTMLLKHLPMKPAMTTVEEYLDARGERHNLLIKYAGVVVHGAEKTAAAQRLLAFVDEHLFCGNPHYPDREREIEGLLGFAHDSRIDVYSNRERFYERFAAQHEGKALRLFTPTHAQPIHEGELPVTGPTFAVGAKALAWWQLLPVMYIPLAPVREGLVMFPTNIVRPAERTVEPKHEGSQTRERGAVVMYGGLELYDPDAVFMLKNT